MKYSRCESPLLVTLKRVLSRHPLRGSGRRPNSRYTSRLTFSISVHLSYLHAFSDVLLKARYYNRYLFGLWSCGWSGKVPNYYSIPTSLFQQTQPDARALLFGEASTHML